MVLVALTVIALTGYSSAYQMNYASVRGIFTRIITLARCELDTSPYVNFTSNVLVFSTNPSLFSTDIVGAKFMLIIDSTRIGLFSLPYDTNFENHHESIPWLLFSVLKENLQMSLIEANSSYVVLTMEALATGPLYREQVSRSDSFKAIWKIGYPEYCQGAYRS